MQLDGIRLRNSHMCDLRQIPLLSGFQKFHYCFLLQKLFIKFYTTNLYIQQHIEGKWLGYPSGLISLNSLRANTLYSWLFHFVWKCDLVPLLVLKTLQFFMGKWWTILSETPQKHNVAINLSTNFPRYICVKFLIYSLLKMVFAIKLKLFIKMSSDSIAFCRTILESNYFIKINFQFTLLIIFLILSG